MFVATLFVIEKKQKQPRGSETKESLVKLQSVKYNAFIENEDYKVCIAHGKCLLYNIGRKAGYQIAYSL